MRRASSLIDGLLMYQLLTRLGHQLLSAIAADCGAPAEVFLEAVDPLPGQANQSMLSSAALRLCKYEALENVQAWSCADGPQVLAD